MRVCLPRIAMILSICLLAAPSRVLGAEKAVERVQKAADALQEILASRDRSIPLDLLGKAHCVAVIPGMKEGGFIFAGKYGKGLISCRGKGGKGWTGPSTIRIEGGSFGLQIGGTLTDLVLLIMNKKGKDKLISSKFTLGVDAAAAAGPVGRTAAAQTDVQMRAEILSYSRSRGVFAGVSLEGATLRPASKDNRKLYGRHIRARDILDGDVEPPPAARGLIAVLNRYSSAEHR